jgi:hypothetical protein
MDGVNGAKGGLPRGRFRVRSDNAVHASHSDQASRWCHAGPSAGAGTVLPGARTMSVVCIGKVEDRLFEFLDGLLHLGTALDMGLELGEVVDGTLAVSGRDNVLGALADLFGDFAPGCFYGADRVGESAVLNIDR